MTKTFSPDSPGLACDAATLVNTIQLFTTQNYTTAFALELDTTPELKKAGLCIKCTDGSHLHIFILNETVIFEAHKDKPISKPY